MRTRAYFVGWLVLSAYLLAAIAIVGRWLVKTLAADLAAALQGDGAQRA
jgi:hypothetical protein